MDLYMDILTLQDICRDYGVSPYFVRLHRLEMGGRGKPLRFSRDLVEEFFESYFREVRENAFVQKKATFPSPENVGSPGMLRKSSNVSDIGQIRGKFRLRNGGRI